ncbi:MAG: type IX secretion system outer membrane channel protein PorV [Sphingobacteriaceae bacterium]|nr:type IX secretion system outer membrane channel protein PorV [Sphingobacteriaceae bacterium]
MERISYKKIVILLLVALASLRNSAQISSQALGGSTINPITTAVPFLLISPDSKHGAMGDVGVATDADANSTHWNQSKLAFADKKFGVALTATPWLRNLVPDIYLYYLSGYSKISKPSAKNQQAVSASLRYFTLGNIQLTDAQGNSTGDFKPNEFALDLGFAQKLGKNFSTGVAFRFVNSSISRVYFNGQQGNAASTVAVDLTMYYKSNVFKLGDKKAYATSGLAFTNLGTKIKYSTEKNFIPMNMRLGGGLKVNMDDFNTFGVYLDFNKLLVPTPPIYQYQTDSLGNTTTQIAIDPTTGAKVIAKGKNPNVPVAQGILQSFGDAPGGFKEEMSEFNISTGLEYEYNKTFAVRAGYFHEPKTKGARQFFTVGIGLRYSIGSLDISYLIPRTLNNPLQNTFRFSLGFYFDADTKKKEEPVTP